jgi:uncharacterized protein (TIGR02117 family)
MSPEFNAGGIDRADEATDFFDGRPEADWDQDAAMLLRLCRWLLVLAGSFAGADLVPAEETIRFYVDSHGWHTGIILPVRAIPADLHWPIAGDFREFEFIEVGWGHKAFYMARRFDLGIAFTAFFGVSPSVLHVCGVGGPPAEYFVESRVFEIRATPEQFRALCASIAAATTLDASGRAMPLAPGLYGRSRFYEANGKYYLPKTCNYWTVAQLRNANYDVTPLFGLTAGGVCRQVRHLQQESKTQREGGQSVPAARR